MFMLLAVCSNTYIGNKQVCESVEKLQNALRKRCNLEGLVFSIDSLTFFQLSNFPRGESQAERTDFFNERSFC